MQYLMAIDAGTGSVRAVIFDANGKQIAVEDSVNGCILKRRGLPTP